MFLTDFQGPVSVEMVEHCPPHARGAHEVLTSTVADWKQMENESMDETCQVDRYRLSVLLCQIRLNLSSIE